MLVILFGSTVEMGARSRQYFQDNGFELIQKYNYIPENNILPSRFGSRMEAAKEDVLKCDFVYESNDILVGFSKEQIIDSVRGRKKSLITTSAGTIDFIRQIKAAYGDYVTVIGTYIDDRSLKIMFESLENITDKELAWRINKGKDIKKSLLSDRKLFDYIVMYGGEESEFNIDALKIQYNYIIDEINRIEKKLNEKMYVEMPYVGSDDYVFVSYSHSDIDRVFPFLHKLQLAGYRVWYDEGIRGGENWRKIVASKIQDEKCKDFLLFSSANSVNSIHVNAEIGHALDYEKKITTIRLDDSKFDSGVEMYLKLYKYLIAENNPRIDEELQQSLDNLTQNK